MKDAKMSGVRNPGELFRITKGKQMKKRRKKSKYEDEAVLVKTKVNKIDFINQLVKDKYKSVFYCPSYIEPEGRRCIYWGRITLEAGDEVEMKGRLSDGTFLVWSLKLQGIEEEGARRY